MPTTKRNYKKRNYKRRKPRKKKWGNSRDSTRADYSTKTREGQYLLLQNDSTVDVKYARAFSFQDILNYANYNIWDQYRINCIVAKISPNLTQVVNGPYDDTTNPGTGKIPNYCVYVDRDDSAAGQATYEELKSRQGSIIRPCTKGLTLKFRPTRLLQVYKSAVSSGYMCDNSKKWLDDRAIPHYGLKIGIENGGTTNKFGLRVEYTYYISLKNRRE